MYARLKGLLLNMALLSMGMRGSSIIFKFALSLFLSRFLGLSDLGVYGLILGAAAMTPALLGLGLNGPLHRQIVDADRAYATRLICTRFLVSAVLYVIVVPLAMLWIVHMFPGAPIYLLAMIVAIVILEHLTADIHGVLVFRHHNLLASILLFLRTGAWPLPFMLLAWADPDLRTMSFLTACWLAALLAVLLLSLLYALRNELLRNLSIDLNWMRQAVAKSVPFYIFDSASMGSLYVDRYIMTSLLGLSLTGIYTFYWSLSNAIMTVVIYGVLQPFAPQIVAAVAQADRRRLNDKVRQMRMRILMVSLLIGGGSVVCVPVIVHYLGDASLDQQWPVMIVLMIGTVIRLMAESRQSVLYAFHKDWETAGIGLLGVICSVAVTVILSRALGLLGTALAFAITSSFLLVCRDIVVRRAMAELPGGEPVRAPARRVAL
ncbi:N/A [soil metagenome]